LPETTASNAVPGDRLQTPEEYVGYGVRDPLGQKIGTVDELFVNAYDEPEYVRIRMGFLGLKSVLLPVETVAVDKQHRTLVLHWGESCDGLELPLREQIAGAVLGQSDHQHGTERDQHESTSRIQRVPETHKQRE
jgi:hypothetical protein